MRITLEIDEETVARLIARVARELPRSTSAMSDELVDAKTAGLTGYEFRRAIRTGVLLGSKVGRRYVARRSDLDAYLATKRVDVTASRPLDEASARDEFDRAVARSNVRRLP